MASSSLFILSEDLAIPLTSRFLNHLELLDTINNPSEGANAGGLKVIYDADLQSQHAEAVLRNLLSVAKFFINDEAGSQIRWIGTKKRRKMAEEVEEEVELEDGFETTSPLAFTVLIDKVCKIGRKARRSLLISTCLKFYAALVVTAGEKLAAVVDEADYEPAFLSIVRMIDHVQTHTISRDQVHTEGWKQCLELAAALLERIKRDSLLGSDRHARLNLQLVKSMSAARIAKREELKQMAMKEPEKAAKRKMNANQRKYRSRKQK